MATTELTKSELQALYAKLDIQTIFIGDSRFFVHDDYHPDISDVEVAPQSFSKVISCREVITEDEEQPEIEYIYTVANGVRLVPKDRQEELLRASEEEANEHVLVEIVAHFKAHYLAKERLSKQEMAEFAKANVRFNVWPYWREYVHSCCHRMGLPPLAIPLWKDSRLRSSPKKQVKSESPS